MKVLMLGVGAVGGFFGGKLLRSGIDTSFMARGETLEALKKNGLRVIVEQKESSFFPIQAVGIDSDFSDIDIFIISVKSFQLENLLESIKGNLLSHQLVIPLCNGVDSIRLMEKYIPEGNRAQGFCGVVSRALAPGVISANKDKSFIRFKELDPTKKELAIRLEKAFSNVGVEASRANYSVESQWRKFLFISVWSSVGIVSSQPIGEWRQREEYRKLATGLIEEALALYSTQGVCLSKEALNETMAWFDRVEASSTTSLQDDIDGQRPSEIQSLVFIYKKWAMDQGIDLPHFNRVYVTLSQRFSIVME